MQTPDNKPGLYYVSVMRDNGDWRPLAGPFRDNHADALAMVEPARKHALDSDPRAVWYMYGTVRIDYRDNAPLGMFNKALGMTR